MQQTPCSSRNILGITIKSWINRGTLGPQIPQNNIVYQKKYSQATRPGAEEMKNCTLYNHDYPTSEFVIFK